MTTFEEDIVEIYYNLNDYFTMKNVMFSAIEKRPGGKGRGELDLLAIKIKNGKFEDAIHVEVGVSVTSKFPFTGPRLDDLADECNRLVKKFFTNDGEHKIKEIIGNTEYRRIWISSELWKDAEHKLEQRIPAFGAEVISTKRKDGKINLIVKHGNKELQIEVFPFIELMKEMGELFKRKNLLTKNFQDQRFRAIQYYVNKP